MRWRPLSSRARPFTVQHRIVRPDGVVRTVIVRGGYMPGPRGPRAAADGHDPGRHRSRPGYEERLWHLANQDSLTGLFNRRRFMEELSREVAVARRTGSDGAVLMLDLDRFKEVNDSLGHVAGDKLLTRVADALRGRLRATDTLARLGGDEFAVVLAEPAARPRPSAVAAQLGDAIQEGRRTTIAGRRARRSAPASGSRSSAPREGETAEEPAASRRTWRCTGRRPSARA